MRIFGKFINTRKIRINPAYRFAVKLWVTILILVNVVLVAFILYLFWHYQDRMTAIVLEQLAGR